jgi:competence protein ComEC
VLSHGERDPTRASRPLPRSLIALAAFVAGLITARAVPGMPAGAALGLAGFLCAAAGLTRGRKCKALLTAAAFIFGFGWFTARVHEHSPRWLGGQPPGLVRVEGIVLDTPRTFTSERHPLNPNILPSERGRFGLAVTHLIREGTPEPASGTVWVRVAGGFDGEPPCAGDRVRITGDLEHLPPARNPGERDRRLWGVQDGRVGWLRLTGSDLIEPATQPTTLLGRAESWWLRSRTALADRAHEILLGGAEKDEGRALLGALVLGDDDRVLRDVRTSFNRLGLAHILTISGFHLAVMTGVVLVLLRLWGDIGRWEPIIAATLILAYLAILPFNAPVWRSGLMILGLLAADALGRRHDRLAILGWIAFIILLYRPLEAWSIGFQLSFGLVGLLIWLGEFVHGRLFGIRLRGLVPEPERGVLGMAFETLRQLTSTSLLCGLVATPIVAYHTGLVSPVAVLTSIVLVPPITVLLIAAYIILLLGVMAPPLAGFASQVLGVLSDWTSATVRWVDSLPGTSFDVPRISLALALAATGAILYWFIRGRKRDVATWALAITITAWTIAEFRLSVYLSRNTLVRVDTLAVGDGTCHLIRSGPDAMLWDCGSLEPGIGEVTIPRAVRELGAVKVPTVLVTHPNVDHFNGLIDIAEPLGIKLLITGEAVAARVRDKSASAEAYLFSELARRGVEIRIVAAGDRIELGDVQLEIISPARGTRWTTDNDASLVARIVPKGGAPDDKTAVLLTGDIQNAAIESILESHPRLRPQVIEAPHHGSPRESGIAFVSRLGPEIVLQSTGPSRAGDPRWQPVRDNTRFYCTAIDGAAWVEVKKDGTVRSGAMIDTAAR